MLKRINVNLFIQSAEGGGCIYIFVVIICNYKIMHCLLRHGIMHCLLRHGIINFPQAIGSSIPTNELVSSNGKVVKKRHKASSFMVEISDAEIDIDLDEFPELSNEEELYISDNLTPPDSEKMITQDEKSNSDFYKSKCTKKGIRKGKE